MLFAWIRGSIELYSSPGQKARRTPGLERSDERRASAASGRPRESPPSGVLFASRQKWRIKTFIKETNASTMSSADQLRNQSISSSKFVARIYLDGDISTAFYGEVAGHARC